MRKLLTALMLLAGLLMAGGQSPAAETPAFQLDPRLTVAQPPAPAPAATAPVTVETAEEQTNLRLQTEGPVVPYVGAGLGPPLSAEEQRLLAPARERGALADYHLEAGIGLQLEDRASLSLGYRFSNPPSLLDERRNDPLSLSGDVRIMFGVKLPFE